MAIKKPWGSYEVLSKNRKKGFLIKRIVVEPLCRTSLQTHEYRHENWVVISGKGKAQIAGKTVPLEVGDNYYVMQGIIHRIDNMKGKEPLVLIEIQTGEKFSENDIIRYEDDYGRES